MPMRATIEIGRPILSASGTTTTSYSGIASSTPAVLANEIDDAGILKPPLPMRRSIASPGYGSSEKIGSYVICQIVTRRKTGRIARKDLVSSTSVTPTGGGDAAFLAEVLAVAAAPAPAPLPALASSRSAARSRQRMRSVCGMRNATASLSPAGASAGVCCIVCVGGERGC